jgi:serine/threonine-protein kinase RsbW
VNSLRLPGILDSLEELPPFLKEAAQKAGLDSKASYRLQLAVDEVVTNIIVHGYQEAGIQGNVDLQAQIDDRALTITVEDTGAKFDPTQCKPPDNLDTPLEDRSLGGLGVYLALKTVDRFTYERIGDRNRNQFVVYRRAPAQNAPSS